MPGVELTASVCDGHVVVVLCGDLDVTGAADTEAAITALMARGQSLVIDMSALDFIDCSSLGALVRVQRLARRGGGDVVLAAPQSHARRRLSLTGTDEAFWVQASVPAAVAGVASRRRRYPWRLAVRTDRHRPIVAVITTVSAAPAERDMPSTARSRLKHIVRRAEVFTDRLGALVSLWLPLAAG